MNAVRFKLVEHITTGRFFQVTVRGVLDDVDFSAHVFTWPAEREKIRKAVPFLLA
jgi:hypothetical protein